MKQKFAVIREKILLSIFYFPSIIYNLIYLRLFGKDSYITSSKQGDTSFDNKNYALFIYWQKHSPPWYVLNALKELKKLKINTILVSNSIISSEDLIILNEYCCTIIERENQGFDFGGFKDGIKHIFDNNIDINRLILMNDSVYYTKSGLNNLMSELATRPDDVVASFENWEIHYHYQSFLLSISGNLLQNKKFKKYWDNYTPISNRRWCIHRGEVHLSRVINQIASTTHVVFTAAKLLNELSQTSLDIHEFGRTSNYPKHLRIQINKHDLLKEKTKILKIKTKSRTNNKKPHWEDMYSFYKSNYIDKLIEVSHSSSPIHCSLYLYLKFMRCPIIKKDLVYRDRFNIFELERIFEELIDPSSARKIASDMRLKGSGLELTGVKRIRFDLGVI